ncbi:MAG: hypothetical protein ACRDQ7_11575 [Haloechinothrix sp.]
MTPDESEYGAGGTTANNDFASELRAAIKASRLSLDRIQVRLRNRGVAVSITALSYWQSGKRQPERARSISAVRALEQILNRPEGSLVDLLPPPRPRGPASRYTGGRTTDTPHFQRDVLLPLLTRLDAADALDQHVHLQLASLHDRCDIAADGGQVAVTSRAVFQANADAQHRWLLVYAHDDTATWPPTLRAERNCILGRVEMDQRHGIIAAELLFDRPVDRGESYLIEYSITNDGPPYPRCMNTHWREFRRPVREYLLEVRFDEDRPPTHCWQYARTSPAAASDRRDLRLDHSCGVHAIALDFGPGIFGIGWS